ncbi:hypothetical protein F2P56_016410 [Juglans regia]|uniref:F-box/LRR-repeat protein At3g03360-like n=2 Tax=Juglans regia TaxID=51240 RepID=A0A6P9EYU6_JUGRE|nr:F-box/LRR-repeat protein At3g03360-like [Juglans regia]XP_035547748.1 F-box/LRR-repeat protein At3g03360-like [Juglans regia]KAF5466490.1 hypothetical protein F2P56_016410 [Juglans regia]
MDRISELPEPILQQILSLLPMKQGLQTSVLSKRWRHVWTNFPVLEFDRTFFDAKISNRSDTRESIPERQRKIDELFNFVEQTLLIHRNLKGIRRFTLEISFHDPELASLFDRWIGYLLESNVYELKLGILVLRNGEWYNLPGAVLAAKSVTMLTLSYCKLRLPYSDIKLLSLKKLSLVDVYIEDEIFQNLVARCPMIEDMNLSGCCGLKSFEVFGLLKLKSVEVKNNRELEKVEMQALNLQSFEYSGRYKPCEINLVPCKSLKTLKLCMAAITDEWFHDHFSEFPLLENLALSDCRMLESIRISSHHLKRLLLCRCDFLVEVEIDAPSLCSFKYNGDTIPFSLNSPALLQSDIHFCLSVIDTAWYVQMIEFLSKFNHSEVLTLQSITGKNMVVPNELRESLLPPLYNVKHLKLKIHKPLMSCATEELVDSLLWISPHPETLFIESGFGTKTFKFIYKKLTERGEDSCGCRSVPIICWRHCLQEIEVENVSEAEERNKLTKFFWENAKILERIDGLDSEL